MRYELHGLNVYSNAAIPGLPPAEEEAEIDLQIWLGESPFPQISQTTSTCVLPIVSAVWFETPFRMANGEPVLTAWRLGGGSHYRITYSDGIDFIINHSATDVWVTWPSTLTVREVPSYLLGPIIGVILRLRGITCLHSSAIEFEGRAVAFTGPQGAGKSTLAAAFAVRGVPVLADDTLAMRSSGNRWMASAGYPRVRLSPESAAALRGPGTSALLPPGDSGSMSRFHLDLMTDGCRFRRRPLPIRTVYLFDQPSLSGVPSVEALSPSEALMALVPNTYATRILDRDMRAAEFHVLSSFVHDVPIRRLRRPTDLSRLSELCDFIVDDLHSIDLVESAGVTAE